MKPEHRRTAILAAATTCFAKHGYHATNVSDIIARAKIARGTFYLYFESKEEVFRAILDDFLGHIATQIKTIDLTGSLSPAAQMRANVERLVDAILEHPQPAKIVFNEAVGLNPEIDDRLRAFYGKILASIEASLQKGMTFGIVRKVHPKVAASIVLGAVREVLVQKAVFKRSDIARHDIVDGLIDVLIGGLGSSPMMG